MSLYEKKEFFNLSHYYKVRSMRIAKNLPVMPLGIELDNHKMLNMVLQSISSFETYTVSKVFKIWKEGWFICLLLIDKNDSTRLVSWENINCIDNYIIYLIEKNKKDLHSY